MPAATADPSGRAPCNKNNNSRPHQHRKRSISPPWSHELNALLRLKTTVIGMKLFASVDEMTAIPKIRRPSAVHTTDQIVSMASRLGWTVGITAA